MTAQAKDPTLAMRCPSPLVLFGIDNRGKPKGARFGKEHASLAMKAATQLQLKVLASNDPKVAEIAARLPVGRVHATGRTFVPFIRRDLYDQLVAAAANGNAHPTSPPNGSSGASGSSPGGSAPHLPQRLASRSASAIWSSRQDSLENGWYDAIVVEVNGDMFTLRWRDYPRERPDRAASAAARDCSIRDPSERRDWQIGESCRPGKARQNSRIPRPTAWRLPKDWDEIDINHLVLAKTDRPGGDWWEAIPIEKAGDGFKLRWRDYATLPPAIRPRLELALICPDAD